jgi:hypothetical protein
VTMRTPTLAVALAMPVPGTVTAQRSLRTATDSGDRQRSSRVGFPGVRRLRGSTRPAPHSSRTWRSEDPGRPPSPEGRGGKGVRPLPPASSTSRTSATSPPVRGWRGTGEGRRVTGLPGDAPVAAGVGCMVELTLSATRRPHQHARDSSE